MCGIWVLFGYDDADLQKFLSANRKIHHRGPDAWRLENDCHFKNCCLGFHRLAIVDEKSGMQPMRLKGTSDLWLVCNGEIYNCQNLAKQIPLPSYETKCDVEVILHLYAAGGIEFAASHLDGVFAFCLVDTTKRKVFIARDTFGVRPMFKLTKKNGFLGICSEAKSLMDFNELNGAVKVEPVAPGYIEEHDLLDTGLTAFKQRIRFHKVGDRPRYLPFIPWNDVDSSATLENIKNLLEQAVRKRLMAQRRIGCLLSGGLDSSLVAALLLKFAKESNITYPIQTFSIGMTNSPDVLAARKVAKHIGSEHHEVIFTPEEATQAIDEVIYHLECYDITTIRASIGMYLVSKYVSQHTDTVVLFSGEGADEVAQGYIYFRDAPSPDEGDKESQRLLNDLYLYDVLRADRTTAAHGLELRVPFLDHQFTSYYLEIEDKMRQPQNGVEKYLLRKAFADTGLLPDEILWRHKEAFSDGVASKEKSLFIYIQEHVESLVSDDDMKNAANIYPINTPHTKESYYYRQVFESHYPHQTHWTPYYWLPRWTTSTDPSARYLQHYSAVA